MIEAPDFNTIKKHKTSGSGALCCIVLAPKFHKLGYDGIISRSDYLDERSKESIHFYCVGYGAYWNNEYAPDMEPLSISKEIPWCFSQRFFARFVDDMEQETNWRYRGGTELIVLNPEVDFSDCVIFNLDNMIRDNVILHAGEMIELLIQHARVCNDFHSLSAKKCRQYMAHAAKDGLIGILPSALKVTLGTLVKGRHYILKDISKRPGKV